MNFIYKICLLITLTLFSFTWAERTLANPGATTELLYRKQVYRHALRGLAQDVYVAYPKDNDINPPDVNIVSFRVVDHDPNIFGAKPVFAYSVDDDIYHKLGKATIILRGQESRGINSTVEFHGFRN